MTIWNTLWPFGMYSLWSFVIFFPIWNVWIKKNLATLQHKHRHLINVHYVDFQPYTYSTNRQFIYIMSIFTLYIELTLILHLFVEL
jgi:hypothetical protein